MLRGWLGAPAAPFAWAGPDFRRLPRPDQSPALLREVRGLSAGTFRIQLDDILAKDDKVVVLCTESAQRAGRSWSSPEVHVWTVKDGRLTIFWQYQGDQRTEDESGP